MVKSCRLQKHSYKTNEPTFGFHKGLKLAWWAKAHAMQV